MPESQREAIKTAAVIYLSSHRPLHLPDFFKDFHDNWPSQSLEKTRHEPHVACFRVGRSDFSLELHHSAVPDAITKPVADSMLHWPTALDALARHVAYLELMASSSSQGQLTLACDLTRAIASLLGVTDSIAVCWLNGPSLNQSKAFIATAGEMFATGLYPLPLWVAIRWDEKCHTLSTRGMRQFGSPEVILRRQPDAAPLMVDYLFQTALSLLVSRHPIRAGETLEGPHGPIKVNPDKIDEKGRVALVLEPLHA